MKIAFTLLFMVFLFQTNISLASYMRLKADNIPLELKLIIESTEITDENKAKLLNALSEISEIITKSNDHTQIKFLLKLETSKFILRWFGEKVNPMIFDLKPETFEQKVTSLKLNAFARWLISGFVTDFHQIKRDPGYAAFSNEYRKKRKNTSPEYKRLEKKLSLLSPWINFLYHSSTDEVEFELFKLQSSLFERLLSRLKMQYLIANNYPEFSPKEFSSSLYEFYEKESDNSDEALTAKIKNLETPQSTAIPEAKQQWTPESVVKKILPNYPQHNPNYKAPEKLPVPVNDWLLEL